MQATTRPHLQVTSETDAIEAGCELRCSACHRVDATHVCAKCGTPLCPSCTGAGRSFFVLATSSYELATDSSAGAPVFCKSHRRYTPSPSAVALTLLGMVAIAALARGSPFSLLAIPAALILANARNTLDRAYLRKRHSASRTLAACGRYRFRSVERCEVDYSLGAGSQYADYRPLGGELTISVRFEKEHKERLRRSPTKPDELHAGFFQWRGKHVQLMPDTDERSRPFALRGPMPSDFSEVVPHSSFGFSASYGIARDQAPNEPNRSTLPLLMVPDESTPAANVRAWGLAIRLANTALHTVTVSRLVVTVPPELRTVEFTNGIYEPEKSEVVWRDLHVTREDPARLHIEFSEPIHAATSIDATYEAEAPSSSLSDIEIPEGWVWFPNGEPVPADRVSFERSSSVSGRVHVATKLQPKRQEIIRLERLAYTGRSGMVDVVHQLLVALAERGLAATDVTELPRPLLPESVMGASRCWDILGRYYVENQPYDVHIVVDAEERTKVEGEAETRFLFEVIVRNLSESEFIVPDEQRVEAATLDITSAIQSVLDRPGGK